ncbi:MAG: DUF134 domain-containing protein [Verrucomicrobiota bacterium]
MPRPPCPRHIAHRAPCSFFKPAGTPLYELEEMFLAADELEALRLADCEDLYGVEAAARMKVSRQTFERILKRARGKVSCALVKGMALRIEQVAEVAPVKPARRKSAVKPRAR